MSDEKTVNARYIIHTGTYFDHEAPWPHQNMIDLAWGQDTDDEHVIEFVFFGQSENRLIYHDVQIEQNVKNLT